MDSIVDTCMYTTLFGVSSTLLNANRDTISNVNKLDNITDLVCIGLNIDFILSGISIKK
jgi:hypothetical protein